MDPITHGLTGAAISLLKRSNINDNREVDIKINYVNNALVVDASRVVLWTLLFSSVLPDIDYIFRMAGDFAYFKFHRGPTHSVLGVVLQSAALVLLLSRFFPGAKKTALFGWSVLGMSVHVFMDLLTTYSTHVLWPFSSRPFAFDVLMIVDPVIWIIIILGLIAGRIKVFQGAGRKIGVIVLLAVSRKR